MVAITFIAADGGEQVVDAEAGLSLMENAVANGVEAIVATCGGNAYCGTCRVYLDASWDGVVGELSEIERPMIEESGEEAMGARLSCQIVVTEAMAGLAVRTPADQV